MKTRRFRRGTSAFGLGGKYRRGTSEEPAFAGEALNRSPLNIPGIVLCAKGDQHQDESRKDHQ